MHDAVFQRFTPHTQDIKSLEIEDKATTEQEIRETQVPQQEEKTDSTHASVIICDLKRCQKHILYDP